MESKDIRSELKELRAEHFEIQRFGLELDGFRRDEARIGDLAILVQALNFAHAHHEREERSLFPWLSQQAWVDGGGPKCTDFLGRRLVGLSTSRKIFESENRQFQKPDFLPSASSPLAIPLEEHQAGAFLSGKIFARLQQTQDPGDRELRQLVTQWLDLMEEHRRKEDECLFPMIEMKL